ncbi:hypothetical protein ES703_26449 [subsurface metagenome]
MVNTNNTKMVLPKRVFRQHNSLVVTLPILIRRKLGIKKGDYLLFEWSDKSKKVEIDRFRGNAKDE